MPPRRSVPVLPQRKKRSFFSSASKVAKLDPIQLVRPAPSSRAVPSDRVLSALQPDDKVLLAAKTFVQDIADDKFDSSSSASPPPSSFTATSAEPAPPSSAPTPVLQPATAANNSFPPRPVTAQRKPPAAKVGSKYLAIGAESIAQRIKSKAATVARKISLRTNAPPTTPQHAQGSVHVQPGPAPSSMEAPSSPMIKKPESLSLKMPTATLPEDKDSDNTTACGALKGNGTDNEIHPSSDTTKYDMSVHVATTSRNHDHDQPLQSQQSVSKEVHPENIPVNHVTTDGEAPRRTRGRRSAPASLLSDHTLGLSAAQSDQKGADEGGQQFSNGPGETSAKTSQNEPQHNEDQHHIPPLAMQGAPQSEPSRDGHRIPGDGSLVTKGKRAGSEVVKGKPKRIRMSLPNMASGAQEDLPQPPQPDRSLTDQNCPTVPILAEIAASETLPSEMAQSEAAVSEAASSEASPEPNTTRKVKTRTPAPTIIGPDGRVIKLKRPVGRPRIHPKPDPNAPKRPRGRPPKPKPPPVPGAVKRGRGRPRKHPLPDPNAPKRPVGRPRKYPRPEEVLAARDQALAAMAAQEPIDDVNHSGPSMTNLWIPSFAPPPLVGDYYPPAPASVVKPEPEYYGYDYYDDNDDDENDYDDYYDEEDDDDGYDDDEDDDEWIDEATPATVTPDIGPLRRGRPPRRVAPYSQRPSSSASSADHDTKAILPRLSAPEGGLTQVAPPVFATTSAQTTITPPNVNVHSSFSEASDPNTPSTGVYDESRYDDLKLFRRPKTAKQVAKAKRNGAPCGWAYIVEPVGPAAPAQADPETANVSDRAVRLAARKSVGTSGM